MRGWLAALAAGGLVACAPALAETAGDNGVEVVHELAPYYSSLGVYVPLSEKPIQRLGAAGEAEIYRTLLLDAFLPRFMLLEASVYPMPLAGVYLRKNHPGLYDDADFSGGFNLVESVTAGFEEPYAFSAFFGNVVDYAAPEAIRGEINKGHVGYLISTGNYHIKANELINDNWLELEYKLKSDRHYRNHRLSMSYRMGVKWHDNPGITDTVYLGLRRNHLDYNAPTRLLPLLENSNIAYRISVDRQSFSLVEQELTVGKKWPLQRYNAAFVLDLGFVWYTDRKYSAALAGGGGDEFIVILRPNLEF
ncbi:MAG: hypothetical protein AB1450_01115 [Pseudomonadota bacterium]